MYSYNANTNWWHRRKVSWNFSRKLRGLQEITQICITFVIATLVNRQEFALWQSESRPSFDPPEEKTARERVCSWKISKWCHDGEISMIHKNEVNELFTRFVHLFLSPITWRCLWFLHFHHAHIDRKTICLRRCVSLHEISPTHPSKQMYFNYRIFIFGLSKVSFIIQSSRRKVDLVSEKLFYTFLLDFKHLSYAN